MDVSMKVAGQDVDGKIELSQDRERYRADVIVKDGIQYVRPAGEGWIRQAAPLGTFTNPFVGRTSTADWVGMERVETVRRDGQLLHHLRLPDFDWQTMSSSLLDENAGGMEIKQLLFDIWVTDNGVPASANIAFDGTTRANGIEADFTFDLDYTFTKFGEPIVIEAPQNYDDETDPGTTG
jgi:hypothetical protein